MAKPAAPTRDQLLGATVTGVFDAPVTLAAGRYEGPPAEAGAASKPTLKLWDSTIEFVDLDGAPPEEGVALLTSSEGGSGTYSHLGVFNVQDGKAATLGVVPLGDRVQLFRLWHEPGKVLLDIVEPGPGDPSCCPTQLSRKAFGWKDGKLQPLASDVVGGLSINLLAATDWMLVEMDGQPLPAGVDAADHPGAVRQGGGILGLQSLHRTDHRSGAGHRQDRRTRGDAEGLRRRRERTRSGLPRPDARDDLVWIPGRPAAAGGAAGRRAAAHLLFSR